MFNNASVFFTEIFKDKTAVSSVTGANGIFVDNTIPTAPIVNLGYTSLVLASVAPAPFSSNRFINFNGFNLNYDSDSTGTEFIQFQPGLAADARVYVKSTARDGKIVVRVENANATTSAAAGVLLINNAGKSGSIGITSSVYTALNFPSNAITIDGSANNGIFLNARGGAAAGIYFAVNGIGVPSTAMVLNPSGRLIIGGGATITPTDDTGLLQVRGNTSITNASLFLNSAFNVNDPGADANSSRLIYKNTPATNQSTLNAASLTFNDTTNVNHFSTVTFDEIEFAEVFESAVMGSGGITLRDGGGVHVCQFLKTGLTVANTAGLAQFATADIYGDISTDNCSSPGNNNVKVKFGQLVTAAVVFDNTKYLTLSYNGIVYKVLTGV